MNPRLIALMAAVLIAHTARTQNVISKELPSPSPAAAPVVETAPTPSAAPAPRFIPGAKELSASFSDAPAGEPKITFKETTPNLYAQWKGNALPEEANIRCVWIAENVGDVAEPNYIIDEAKAIATKSDAYGFFTLSRPEDGWAPGDYRAEFYVNDKLAATVRLKITP